MIVLLMALLTRSVMAAPDPFYVELHASRPNTVAVNPTQVEMCDKVYTLVGVRGSNQYYHALSIGSNGHMFILQLPTRLKDGQLASTPAIRIQTDKGKRHWFVFFSEEQINWERFVTENAKLFLEVRQAGTEDEMKEALALNVFPEVEIRYITKEIIPDTHGRWDAKQRVCKES